MAERNGRLVPIIQKMDGTWITTGEARGWPRCVRCRVPCEKPIGEPPRCFSCWIRQEPNRELILAESQRYHEAWRRAHFDHRPPRKI